jgi:hypothetical protein
MRALLAAALALGTLTACGELENAPLTLGVIRGSLVGATASSKVAVYQRPELVPTLDADGGFEFVGVPVGPVEVLALISAARAERITVDVVGGAVANLGAREGRPVGKFELNFKAPSGQRVDKATALVEGTPLSLRFEEPGEAEFRVPAGCYHVQGAVPGLGSKLVEACVTEVGEREVTFSFPQPDGSPGREGCLVTGCVTGLSCRADGACGD